MTMSHLKIAPVRWFLGQTVLPEHLRAQQSQLRRRIRPSLALFGRPSYGIAELTWSEPLL